MIAKSSRALLAVCATVVAGLLGACGSDDSQSGGDGDDELSAEARRGREIVDDSGCDSCHRSGGIGPAWEGIYGSTVELVDGSTVVADDEYLTLAITDPDAQLVDGFDVAMPVNELSDEEVASVVAYIRELGGSSAPASSGSVP